MITLLGNGAIGNLLALACYRANLPYQVISRSGRPDTIGIEHNSEVISYSPNYVKHTNQIDSGLLILPLKAYQIVPCIKELKPFIGSQVTIVLLHNGMGTLVAAQQMMPNNPIIVATTSYGIYKPDASSGVITGVGETHAGWLVQNPPPLSHQKYFEQLLPPCHWHRDIALPLWLKLSVNAAINPITAIHDVQNGELIDAKYRPQITAVMTEIAAVMTKLKLTKSTSQLLENCLQVAKVTATNFSSMHQDIHNDRKTEVDYINGYVVAEATRLGLSAPENERLLAQIKKMEACSN